MVFGFRVGLLGLRIWGLSVSCQPLPMPAFLSVPLPRGFIGFRTAKQNLRKVQPLKAWRPGADLPLGAGPGRGGLTLEIPNPASVDSGLPLHVLRFWWEAQQRGRHKPPPPRPLHAFQRRSGPARGCLRHGWHAMSTHALRAHCVKGWWQLLFIVGVRFRVQGLGSVAGKRRLHASSRLALRVQRAPTPQACVSGCLKELDPRITDICLYTVGSQTYAPGNCVGCWPALILASTYRA